MAVSKTFSGFNENALRYLLPRWMSAWSGVVMRLGFGAVAFWVIGLFKRPPQPVALRDKIGLMVMGAILMFGYMSFLLLGLSYTTPVSSSIFISLEPVIVFLICVMFYGESVTWRKIAGIALGLGGALLCILTQKTSDIATNPLLGNVFCLLSSVTYSIFLVISARYLKRLDNVTVSKWSFTGGAITSVVAIAFIGWHAPVLHQGVFSTPMLVLLFVLVFPSVVSYLLVDTGLKYLTPTVVALYGYLILIVATVVSYLLGQDRFDWWQMVSIALIIGSVYFVEVAEAKPSESHRSTT